MAFWLQVPATVFSGEKETLFSFQIWHNGVVGEDSMLDPLSLKVHLADGTGTSLNSTQANQLIDRVQIYADTDGNGVYSAGDSLLLVDYDLAMVDGATTLVFGSASGRTWRRNLCIRHEQKLSAQLSDSPSRS